MQPIIIIGAGISGLTLAQGLRLRSIPFRLFERRANSQSAQGHRFRLAQDAILAVKSVLSSELRTLFDQTAPEPNRFKPRYPDAHDFQFDPPAEAVDAATRPIDRSWLRSLLLLGLEDSIEYTKEFQSFETAENGCITVNFADASSVHGSLLVGADGLKSRVRKQLQPQRQLLDCEHLLMWGRTPLTPELRSRVSTDALSWYMVHDRKANIHTVVEPIEWTERARQASAGKLPYFEDYIYWVISIIGGNTSIAQTAAERRDLINKATETWHPDLKLLFSSAPDNLSSCLPCLSSAPEIELTESSLTGLVTLIGDACHPMSPAGGSGATVAVQDAADLAATIGDLGASRRSLRQFEERMATRAKAKIEHSFERGKGLLNGKEWYEYRAVAV